MTYMSHPTQQRSSRNNYQYASSQLQQYSSLNSLLTTPDANRHDHGTGDSSSGITRYASPLSSNSIPSPPSVSPVPVSRDGSAQQSAAKSEESSQEVYLQEALSNIISLKRFLASAPVQFNEVDIIRQFRLPTDEQISCVRWNQIFCITGTDIVRCLVYRFSLFGRDVVNRKKFEEGVFSDLRNLKINVDAMLESPKSELLGFLYKRHCVRTKKKQKIFFWHSVHHEQLFIDALERELKKEAATKAAFRLAAKAQSKGFLQQSHLAATSASNPNVNATMALREPAISFKYDSTVPLSEQLVHIVESMPKSAALVVRETMTSPKDVYDPPGIETQAPSLHRLNTEVHPPEKEYLRTPIQSREKLPLDPSGLIGHWYPETPERQSAAASLATPQSLNYRSDPRSAAPEYLQQPPVSSALPIHPQPEPSLHMPRHYGPGAWVPDAEPPHLGAEATDFPLEVLTKEDQNYQRFGESPSFDSRYTEFAYSNRPAILFDPSGHQSVQAGPSLGPPITFLPQSASLSPIQRSYPQLPPPQSPDWDQFMETSFDWSANGTKSPLTDPKVPRATHVFSPHYNGTGRVAKNKHPDLRRKAAHQHYY